MWELIKELRRLAAFLFMPHVILSLAKDMPTMNRALAWDPIGGFVIVLAFIVGTSSIVWDIARMDDGVGQG